MPDLNTWVIRLMTQSAANVEKPLSAFGFRWGQISPLMHIFHYYEFYSNVICLLNIYLYQFLCVVILFVKELKNKYLQVAV